MCVCVRNEQSILSLPLGNTPAVRVCLCSAETVGGDVGKVNERDGSDGIVH